MPSKNDTTPSTAAQLWAFASVMSIPVMFVLIGQAICVIGEGRAAGARGLIDLPLELQLLMAGTMALQLNYLVLRCFYRITLEPGRWGFMLEEKFGQRNEVFLPS